MPNDCSILRLLAEGSDFITCIYLSGSAVSKIVPRTDLLLIGPEQLPRLQYLCISLLLKICLSIPLGTLSCVRVPLGKLLSELPQWNFFLLVTHWRSLQQTMKSHFRVTVFTEGFVCMKAEENLSETVDNNGINFPLSEILHRAKSLWMFFLVLFLTLLSGKI